MGKIHSVRKSVRRGVAALFAAAALMAAQAPAAEAFDILLNDVGADRIERQRAHGLGLLPLAGTPNLARLEARFAEKGLVPGSAIFVRIFKIESELELWILKGDRFVLLATYPICHWSGTIGPKMREGDSQAPEGLYTVTMKQMRLKGRWQRAFNLGFPNPLDQIHQRTGSFILVHGGCSSVGCFAMTDAVMEEIYTIAEQALKGRQDRFHVHVFPFRMTDANLARHRGSEWSGFWANLKQAYDSFERTRLLPRIGICEQRYLVEDGRVGDVGDENPYRHFRRCTSDPAGAMAVAGQSDDGAAAGGEGDMPVVQIAAPALDAAPKPAEPVAGGPPALVDGAKGVVAAKHQGERPSGQAGGQPVALGEAAPEKRPPPAGQSALGAMPRARLEPQVKAAPAGDLRKSAAEARGGRAAAVRAQRRAPAGGGEGAPVEPVERIDIHSVSRGN